MLFESEQALNTAPNNTLLKLVINLKIWCAVILRYLNNKLSIKR